MKGRRTPAEDRRSIKVYTRALLAVNMHLLEAVQHEPVGHVTVLAVAGLAVMARAYELRNFIHIVPLRSLLLKNRIRKRHVKARAGHVDSCIISTICSFSQLLPAEHDKCNAEGNSNDSTSRTGSLSIS